MKSFGNSFTNLLSSVFLTAAHNTLSGMFILSIPKSLSAGLPSNAERAMQRKHRERERAQIRKDEDTVQNIISSIQNFTNPFNIPDKTLLFNLASDATVSQDFEAGVFGAEKGDKMLKKHLYETNS